MKKISTLLLAAFFSGSFISAQQGVAINTDGSAPHVSAMLDVKNTKKGFLTPRMTAAERIAVETPAAGLMVYETTSNTHWVYNGTAWIQLGSGLQWITNGTNIYNANSGNVGIGTSTPTSKFHLLGNMLMGNSNPVIQFQQAGTDKGFIQLAGNNLRLGTNSDNGAGKIVFRAFGNDHIFIDSIGQLGIGKSIPKFDLDVNGSARIQSLSAYKRSTLSLYANPNYLSDPFGPAGVTFFNWQSLGSNDYDYNAKFRLEMDGGAAERLKLYHVDHDNQLVLSKDGDVGIGKTFPTEKLNVLGNVQLENGNPLLKIKSTSQILPTAGIEINTIAGNAAKILYTDFALKISEGSGSNQFVLKDNKIGIGTDDPLAKLQISGGTGEQLRIFAAEDPILQFADGFAFNQKKKGFVQLSDDNLRIGTNSENTNGKFIVRTGGDDRVFVDASGLQLIGGGVLSLARSITGGLKTVEIKPTENGTDGASVLLYNGRGAVTIELDADYGGDGDGRVITNEIQINGGSDLAENFDVNDAEEKNLKPGMLVSIDTEKEGLLCITKQETDKKIVGVISGANGIKPGMLMGQQGTIAYGKYPVALAGRVYVLCTDEGGAINAGDFLTSSSKRGYAKKAGNLNKAQGAIIGKAMGKADPQTGYVLVLINLQ